MKIKVTLVLSTLLLYTQVVIFAQNSEVDSLKSILAHQPNNDTARVNLLNEISFKLNFVDVEKNLKYAKEADSLSDILNYKKGKVSAWNNLGLYYYYAFLFDSTLSSYGRAMDLSQGLWSPIPKTKAIYSIGNIYRFKGKPERAMDCFNHAVEIYHEILQSDSLSFEVQNGLAATYNNMGNIYYYQGDYPQALEFYQKSLEIVEQIGYKPVVSLVYNNNGNVFYHQGDYPKAMEFYQISLEISEKLGIKECISKCFTNIGFIYYSQGNYSKALEYDQKSLNIREELGDKTGVARAFNYFGVVYYELQDYNLALEYYLKSLRIAEDLNDKGIMSNQFNNIALIYEKKNQLDTALYYYDKCIKIGEEININYILGWAYNGKGIVFEKQKKYDKALKYFLLGLEKREIVNSKKEISQSCNSLGNFYIKTGNYSKAKDYLLRAFSLANEIKNPLNLKDAAKGLTEIFEKEGDYKNSLEYHKKFKQLSDTLFNDEIIKKFAVYEVSKEFEKEKEKQELEKQKQEAIYSAEIRRQAIVRNSSIIGFILMLFLAFFIFRSYRIKYKSNQQLAEQNSEIMEKNEELTQLNEEISAQRNELANLAWGIQAKGEEIESQKNILAVKNKEITDSITYAQRIQRAVLPTNELMQKIFTNYFVLYMPKSIVSGDFYWATQIKEFTIFCVTDCTGHGVPGAFMSMMGVAFLNEIVRKEEVTNAAQVLDQLREHVVASMQEKEGEYVMFDGMDIGFCVLNTKTLKLQFAGANIPCWIATSEPKDIELSEKIDFSNGLIELIPDRMPIARFDRMEPFSMVELQLKKNDQLYISTDGFADQFGGSEGKKFQKSQLKQIIALNQSLPLDDQLAALNTALREWMNGRNQLDDVTVLGVRI